MHYYLTSLHVKSNCNDVVDVPAKLHYVNGTDDFDGFWMDFGPILKVTIGTMLNFNVHGDVDVTFN